MTFAILAAAIGILLITSVLLYRRLGPSRSGATPDSQDDAHPYDALGRAGRAVGGSRSSDAAAFVGDIAMSRGPAFLGVVVDGIGDTADQDRARELVLDAFLTALGGTSDGSGASSQRPRLQDALDAAHGAVQAAAAEQGRELGASVAAAVIECHGLHWISIGNSRICLYRDGALHQVTMDHTFGAWLAEGVMRDQLSPADAAAKQERDALTSYAGGSDPIDCDSSVRPLPLQDGDRVILCTRGVHAGLTSGEMAETIRSAGDEAASALVERALAAASASAPPMAVVDFIFSPAAEVARPDTPALGRSGSRTTVRVTRPAAGAEQARAV